MIFMLDLQQSGIGLVESAWVILFRVGGGFNFKMWPSHGHGKRKLLSKILSLN